VLVSARAAETGNMVFTTDHAHMLTSLPTSATAAYNPASTGGKKCFTRTMSKLLITVWPEKKTIACRPSRKEMAMP